MNFTGTWHIQSMDMWDQNYLNDVQAYIEIKANYMGSFQFGLVSGAFDGEILTREGPETLHFS